MLKKKSYILALALCLLFCFTTAASAYVIFAKWNYNGTSLSIPYAWGSSVTSTWKTAWSTAVSDWNGKPTNVDFTYNSSSDNKLGTVTITGGAYGYCWLETDYNFKIIGFDAAGNSVYTGTTVNRSTANHELGHAQGLDDNPFTGYASIMDTYRDRTKIYTPQLDDVLGVNYMYN